MPRRKATAPTAAPETWGNARTLTVSDAARLAGVPRKDLFQAVQAGQFPNAYRATPMGGGPGSGQWRIPLSDLVDARLLQDDSLNEPPMPDPTSGDLRRRLQELEQRLAVAEALAAERASTIDTLTMALRALERTVGQDEPRRPL